jgi:hypothetical protein
MSKEIRNGGKYKVRRMGRLCAGWETVKKEETEPSSWEEALNVCLEQQRNYRLLEEEKQGNLLW